MTTPNVRPRRPHLSAAAAVAAAPERSPSGRELITPGALVRLINHELQARPACTGIRVHAGAWELDDLADGCNWSERSLSVRVWGVASRSAFDELRRVLERARQRYNVHAPEAYLM